MPDPSPHAGARKVPAKKPPASGRKAPDDDAPLVGDEDLPILTEVVSSETQAAQTAHDARALADAAHFQAITAEIVEAVKKRFSYELTTLLEAVLLNTTEELEAGITTIVETAVRELTAKKFGKPTDVPPF
ncbi:MAG: hypothetical protein LBL72_02695 [Candidatus Accumulibacter sp.]|jgi:hypothetical protein|nr:hypothetical protein [Accumulibacter sp.]